MSDEGDKSSWLRPLPDEYTPAEGDMTGRRMLVAALTVIILAIFGGLVWYSYMQGNDNGPVPVVRADKSVIKEKPDTPGGLEVPDQDKNVFNKITSADAEKAEMLAPSAELPMERPKESLSIEKKQKKNTTPVKAEPVSQKKTSSDAIKVASAIPEKDIEGGTFFVQLGAFGKKKSAEQLWQKLGKDNAALLAGLSSDIMMVDLGKKGVLYRLRGGKITTKASADKICHVLKLKKQACIVVTK